MIVGIIGAGLIGNKRFQVLIKSKTDSILAVADINEEKAKNLGELVGCAYFTDPHKVINNPKIDIVVVSTINKYLAPLSLAALKAGKHVLCEKPLGVSTTEIKRCIQAAEKNKLIYKAGYNHRFHPAIFRANQLIKQGKIGKITFIKASYGHGGRVGYEKEWRTQKRLSGGGELLDQGCHIIDLILWFTQKKVSKIHSSLSTQFWPIQPLEDNAFVLLELGDITASFHTSWVQWKNEFIFEVYGKRGYVKINGLGGSYGKETLIFGKRVPGKVPIEQIYHFDEPDNSWALEWVNFKQAIKNPQKLLSSGKESLEVMNIIKKIYNQ
ncbi:MAG: hypothetical protein A3A58_01175 [Candidatus Blackburnbacteria bacterium RIFCSPLOWO2_01_FULL_41_27]|uniref:Oxidoreductase n=2 Tax=Candidatus Blackburniibacteriota TaxID=1817898 RepID=A0A1G1VC80_9BACT|nr:MAG: hypothetical protein A3F61_00850 [Candidatus Blackburnbacteria bacterium RIFCSPHIGHO2_12_FULL_41_13b]OGY13865.1 MAG: hypothetical protein A3A58_01175 [Candidatus Blackburnbacteria bacterium RIFCSPLOWO2_01_FULL_41_27]